MKGLELLLVIVYGVCLSFIFLYSLAQLHLALLYRRKKQQTESESPALLPDTDLPPVTVQLPVYNEFYVVERLIDAVAAFLYPKEKLQIQILDDSTDETSATISAKVAQYQQLGLNICHVKRSQRTGFKAGALQHGLASASGTFITIFDADFIPSPDFLLKTIPAFTAADIGVVQTRWGHINYNFSLLTRLQAFGLNAHFTVEQQGRNNGGHFINFNGTAGVWRKTCIEDAGGWQADTLTEDLDLSYRAQLRNWKFKYLEQVEAPAELPATMPALKSQQYRWTKGAAETARKHLRKVTTGKLPLSTKLHATVHLLNSAIFLTVLFTALLSVPMLFIKQTAPALSVVFKAASVFLLSLFSLSFFYWTSYQSLTKSSASGFWRFIPEFLLFLSMSMGLSLHNAVAVVEGYIGRKTPFVRTPKFNIADKNSTWRNNKYNIRKLNPLTLLEGLLAVYFLWGIWVGLQFKDYGLIPFHTMLLLGYTAVFVYSLRHSKII
ncbi:MAG: glycosyltransferase family 2 protein [Hymenobacteraceae bacterium]|nr:glycosyltransferase family 2 protein [Hymenobacteraceae bacterium]MDX5397695.1 glycosyltransferase family 2 protein [Hymenobacteraceae bacterium]MDX5443617.1 glycosyltransferase family 2 protein [Hymenobacteraceae bacterium]MDX5513773.1 glycosyltransferase family 2 protein [Hymenobacteraceae bacterium]